MFRLKFHLRYQSLFPLLPKHQTTCQMPNQVVKPTRLKCNSFFPTHHNQKVVSHQQLMRHPRSKITIDPNIYRLRNKTFANSPFFECPQVKPLRQPLSEGDSARIPNPHSQNYRILFVHGHSFQNKLEEAINLGHFYKFGFCHITQRIISGFFITMVETVSCSCFFPQAP
jgi:hypothetical protein